MSKVTIVIPTRNRCELLRETLTSVQNQTHPRWEALACDDGSTDGTREMVEQLAAADPRIRFVPGDPARPGAPARRNDGMRAAKGDYLIFLDDDDLLKPDCLSGRLSVLQNDPALDFVVGQAELFRERLGDIGRRFAEPSDEDPCVAFLCHRWPWQTTGPMYRAKSLSRVGEWDESLEVGQDVDIACRIVLKGLHFVALDITDYGYRGGREGSVGSRHEYAEYQQSHLRRLARLVADYPEVRAGSRGRAVRVGHLWCAWNLAHEGRWETATEALEQLRRYGLAGRFGMLRCRLMLRMLTLLRDTSARVFIETLWPSSQAIRRRKIHGAGWRAWNHVDRIGATSAGVIAVLGEPRTRAAWVLLACALLKKPKGNRKTIQKPADLSTAEDLEIHR